MARHGCSSTCRRGIEALGEIFPGWRIWADLGTGWHACRRGGFIQDYHQGAPAFYVHAASAGSRCPASLAGSRRNARPVRLLQRANGLDPVEQVQEALGQRLVAADGAGVDPAEGGQHQAPASNSMTAGRSSISPGS